MTSPRPRDTGFGHSSPQPPPYDHEKAAFQQITSQLIPPGNYYGGDSISGVSGGNVGGRHNTNAINGSPTVADSGWEAEINRIKANSATMDGNECYDAEGVCRRVEALLKEVRGLLAKRNTELASA